ncbi:TolC family protein [Polaromonas sp.]|uniref:TolC family protein n=1 Tax=Polaromonas sp. TaxID=1869339 RepID=UPI003750CA8D
MSAFPVTCRVYLIRSLLAAALLMHVAGPLRAAEPLSLREAQQLAAARSGQLLAQDAATRAAREMAVSAGQLPDPVLKLGIDNLPVTGADRLSLGRDFMTMRRIGLMQELPRAEKRQLKAEGFEREAERAQAQRQMALTSVQQGTAVAWLERYYAQAMRALLQQQLEETRLQEQGANLAFREGRGAQAEVFAARAAQIELEDRLSQIDRQARNASLMLARWIGADASRSLSGEPVWKTMRDKASPDAMLSAGELRQHPRLALSAALVEAAETQARLAQANTRSDWTVEAAYQQRGPAFSNMVSVGVSIPLQWDRNNRQNRDIAAKLAAVDEARANDADTQRAYEAEVRSLLNDWQNGKERVARYTDQMIPVAGQRSAAALTAYRIGKGDLASVLAARREEINTRIQTLSLELETARLWAQLNYLNPDNSIAPGANASASIKGEP